MLLLAASLLAGLLPGPNGFDLDAALREISKTKDPGHAAPLADVLRFLEERESYLATARAFERVSKTKILNGPAPHESAVLWVGEQEKLPPPAGYTAWKGELFARKVDPRYRDLLYDGAPARIRVEEVGWGGVPVDGIPALVNPRMLAAAAPEASYLNGSEPVFGVSIGGDHRAYPLRILDWHEMANDVVGGKPVALAYCTLCGAGILFDTSSNSGDGRRLFGSSGLLYRSNKLMYDRETRTLWNQFTGEPVIGKLASEPMRLPVLPMVLTSWDEWRKQHPGTKVVDVQTGFIRDYRIGATYGRYFGSAKTMFPVWKQSKAMPMKARLYGVRLGEHAKAYPLDELLKAGGVANDALAGKEIVVVTRDAVGRVELPEPWQRTAGVKHVNDLTLPQAREAARKHGVAGITVETMLAMPVAVRLPLLEERTPDERMGESASKGQFTPNFRNEVAQRGLIAETRAYLRAGHVFKAGTKPESIEDEAGRAWTLTEDALVSPGGEKLARVPGHLAYWFGWYAFLPNTEVYRAQ